MIRIKQSTESLQQWALPFCWRLSGDGSE